MQDAVSVLSLFTCLLSTGHFLRSVYTFSLSIWNNRSSNIRLFASFSTRSSFWHINPRPCLAGFVYVELPLHSRVFIADPSSWTVKGELECCIWCSLRKDFASLKQTPKEIWRWSCADVINRGLAQTDCKCLMCKCAFTPPSLVFPPSGVVSAHLLEMV